MPTANRQRGFTLLGLLFLIAGMGVGMAALGTLWHTAAQREKEKDLLFAGDQYRRAIESFWKASPAGQERLPKNFDELLEDPRFPNTVRHLRRLYRDPMTGSAEWGLVKEKDGGIAGVHSLSEGVPFKAANFPQAYRDFAGLPNYRAWIFLFVGALDQAEGTAGVAGASAAGGNKTPGRSAPPQGEAQDNQPRARQIGACNTARLQGYLACQGVLEQGGRDAWLECVNPVSDQFSDCVAQAI